MERLNWETNPSPRVLQGRSDRFDIIATFTLLNPFEARVTYDTSPVPDTGSTVLLLGIAAGLLLFTRIMLIKDGELNLC